MKDLVAEYLSQGLGLPPQAEKKGSTSSPLVGIGERGLPVIRCAPDAPATRMGVEELLKLERETQTEEDMQRAGLPL